MAKITAVLNTLNEEKNLPNALRSISTWVDEIIVVDMYSEDRTVEIAKDYGAKVYFHKKVGYADPAREFALSKATGDWILILDADEVVPRTLSSILCKIKDEDRADIVIIPWLNYLLGKPLMYTGWGPRQSPHARFFKSGFVKPTSTIHNFLELTPGARILNLQYNPGVAVAHFNYINTEHFINKLNRYTNIEAINEYKKGKKPSRIRAVFSATREFLRRYISLQGYRDGWQGFYLSSLSGFYRLITYAKLQEIYTFGSEEAIEEIYKSEIEVLLHEYENP